MRQVFICELFRKFADEHVFNPCIAHIERDLYIVGCRVVRKFATLPEPVRVSDAIKSLTDTRRYTWDVTHPWFGSINSSTWWKAPAQSTDVTRVGVVKIARDGTCKLLRHVHLVDLVGVDARVINVSEPPTTRFMFTFNVWVPAEGGAAAKCGSTVAAIAYTTVRFENSTLIVEQPQPTILCPTISECVEKNWAFWATRKSSTWHISFQYNFSPHHVVVSYETDDIVNNHCNSVVTLRHDPAPFFADMCAFFGRRGDFEISLSTPPLQLAEPLLYMGVGHIKCKWQNILKQPRAPNNQLQNFLHSTSGSIRHPILVYMMFFYLFNASTSRMLHMSNFFTVANSQLVFPCGLTQRADTFVVSCGNLDSAAFVLQLTWSEIDALLSNIDVTRPDYSKLSFVSI